MKQAELIVEYEYQHWLEMEAEILSTYFDPETGLVKA